MQVWGCYMFLFLTLKADHKLAGLGQPMDFERDRPTVFRSLEPRGHANGSDN